MFVLVAEGYWWISEPLRKAQILLDENIALLCLHHCLVKCTTKTRKGNNDKNTSNCFCNYPRTVFCRSILRNICTFTHCIKLRLLNSFKESIIGETFCTRLLIGKHNTVVAVIKWQLHYKVCLTKWNAMGRILYLHVCLILEQ